MTESERYLKDAILFTIKNYGSLLEITDAEHAIKIARIEGAIEAIGNSDASKGEKYAKRFQLNKELRELIQAVPKKHLGL